MTNYDMNGQVALVTGGRSALALQTSIDFGLVIRTPMIEITTIGAGGGSIAWVDRGGFLQIGPESAGSDPGPACPNRLAAVWASQSTRGPRFRSVNREMRGSRLPALRRPGCRVGIRP